MNLFFNPIKDLQNYANQLSGNSTGGKQQKLKTQLYHCTYNDEVKYVIEKSAKQVLHVYPFFESDILIFTENMEEKRFLQLKGILQIEVRGKNCKVDYNMMLPSGYPKKAPYVRIINRNAEYNVDNFYKDLKSPTDPKSFILNSKLNEISKWDPSKSLVNVIIESQDLLRNHFPFLKPKSIMGSPSENNNVGGGGWGSNSPWQNVNPNFNSGGSNTSSWGNNNNNGSGWVNNWGSNNNQGWSSNNPQSGQSGWGSPIQANWGNNNNANWGNNNNSNWGNVGNKQPPIPFQNNNFSQTIAKTQKYVGQNKKVLEKIRNQKLKALDTIQHMEIIKQSIQSEQNYLRNQNFEMTIFLQQSQSSDSEHNLSKMVQTADPLSQQILEVYSNIKAREETVAFLQNNFNEGTVSFEEFLKHLRKIEQEKFDDKVLLSKCMSRMKNQA